MKYIDYKTTKVNEGILYKQVNTEKYKDINIYFSFAMDQDMKQLACLHILKEMIGTSSLSYPTKAAMMAKKCLLYGATADAVVSQFSYHSCLTVHYNFVDPCYLDDVTFNDECEFMKETLFHALLDEELFQETKKIISDAVLRKMDKPSYYSRVRVFEILEEKDKRFGKLNPNIIPEFENITLSDVKDVYEKMLKEANIEIVTVGNISEKMKEELLSFPLCGAANGYSELNEAQLEDLKEITEKRKSSQSALTMIYKLNSHDIFTGKKYYSLLLGNAILGLLPCSLLFQEIREKKSLCYTISSSDNKKDGLLTVHTLISYCNHEEVIKETGRQFERLAMGDYEDETFTMSKKLLTDSLIQSSDDADGVYNYLHSRGFYSDESFEDMLEGINAVTKEDIKELFKGYRHILTYICKGDEEID